MSPTWMACSNCRKEIGYATTYWECSVPSCNRARVRMVLCSLACWDGHKAMFMHRDAQPVESRSPQLATADAAVAPVKRSEASIVVRPGAAAAAPAVSDDSEDVLVVVARMKQYILDKSGMEVSEGVAAALSEHVKMICDLAIVMAGAGGRKVVQRSDVPPARPVGRK